MPAYYTIREASELLGIPTATLYRHAREGRLDHLGAIRIGNKTFIPKNSLDPTPKEAA
ncbi:helix-turn-helix domain-containing protein [Corynebacterium urealyticum]|uniref:helix-turn-helix domain-containing protein n=1 Tax=Corynebacterium urealyticum TaxID=43771 RepID=UPI0011E63B80|nr:helix-turn-helix domain-containing protein [Corynebacterium urealyticum]TYR15603.1 helix-turn-helix domain-containing protein [Corynebacterium urealyticum]TYR17939.1 helix-turn-helix domain-containing protein [Corynebacterium urealyticum]